MKDKSHRRVVSSSLSARIIDYLCSHGHTQVKIARMLGVSEPYISLVKSRERSLTLDHLERLSHMLGLPMGELFILITTPGTLNKATRKSRESFKRVMRLTDRAEDAILRAGSGKSRKAG
jgi:transcriptional regulator with XRE-family HTH domain